MRLSQRQPASLAGFSSHVVSAPVRSHFPGGAPARSHRGERVGPFPTPAVGVPDRSLVPVVLYLRLATAAEADTDRCRLAAARLGLVLVWCQRSSLRTAGRDSGLTRIMVDLAAGRVRGLVTWRGMLDGSPAWCRAFRAAGGHIHYLDPPGVELSERLPNTAWEQW